MMNNFKNILDLCEKVDIKTSQKVNFLQNLIDNLASKVKRFYKDVFLDDLIETTFDKYAVILVEEEPWKTRSYGFLGKTPVVFENAFENLPTLLLKDMKINDVQFTNTSIAETPDNPVLCSLKKHRDYYIGKAICFLEER